VEGLPLVPLPPVPLPVVPPSCSLDDAELREQLGRYRVVGDAAEVLEWDKRRRVIRVAASVPASLVERLVEVERACCPFFELSWEPHDRRLMVSVSDSEHEPALDAIGDALGVSAPVTDAKTV